MTGPIPTSISPRLVRAQRGHVGMDRAAHRGSAASVSHRLGASVFMPRMRRELEDQGGGRGALGLEEVGGHLCRRWCLSLKMPAFAQTYGARSNGTSGRAPETVRWEPGIGIFWFGQPDVQKVVPPQSPPEAGRSVGAEPGLPRPASSPWCAPSAPVPGWPQTNARCGGFRECGLRRFQ